MKFKGEQNNEEHQHQLPEADHRNDQVRIDADIVMQSFDQILHIVSISFLCKFL